MQTILPSSLLLPKEIIGIFEAQKLAIVPRNNVVLSDLVSKHEHLLSTSGVCHPRPSPRDCHHPVFFGIALGI